MICSEQKKKERATWLDEDEGTVCNYVYISYNHKLLSK